MSDTVQLMLVVEADVSVQPALAAALERFDVACVLLIPAGWQPAPMDAEAAEPSPLDQSVCQTLVETIQSHDAAALIADDAAMAQAVSADGCHLDYRQALDETYRTTRDYLGAQAIVGVMPGNTRHMAMTVAEAGADYVGYAVTAAPDDTGTEFVSWWAEIFECPVVAFTDGDAGACERAIDAGPPDFLAVPLPAGADLDGLTAVAQLIEERGQLPVASKDAK